METRLRRVIRKVWGCASPRVKPLPGGITNRNFKIQLDHGAYVVRLAGRATERLGVDRAREHACAKAASALGVAPEVVKFLPRERALVSRFIAGRPLTPSAARRPAMLRKIARCVKKIHEGPSFPGRFSAFETVRSYRRAVGALPPEALEALGRLASIESALGRGDRRPCHNDLLAANIIDDGGTVRILDWEYAGMGDPYFDLGNLCANLGLMPDRRRALLKSYLGRPPKRSELSRLELFRLSSDMREAFWGFLQAGLSEINFDFRGYGRRHLRRFLVAARPELIERWSKDLR